MLLTNEIVSKMVLFCPKKKKILSSGSNSGPLSLGPLIFGSSLEECDTARVDPIYQRSPRNFKWLFGLKLNFEMMAWVLFVEIY